MLAVVLIYQQVENSVLTPTIQGKAVKLSAFFIIISVALFGALLGVVGALIAVPVAATIQIVLGEVTKTYRAQVAAGKLDAERRPPARARVPDPIAPSAASDAMVDRGVVSAPAAVKKAGWGVIGMLAAAQFVMVLDTTVMNVSITQVVADLNTTVVGSADRDHDVHVGHGRLHADRRQDRRPLGRQAGVLDRWARVRGRVVDDGAVAEPGRAPDRLVADRGSRRGARDPRYRRSDRHDLSGQAARAGLRHPRRRQRRLDGGWADHRRLGDGEPLLALRLRRRDGRGVDLDAVPEADPGDGRPQEQARPRRRGALGRRTRRHRVRRPEVEPVGMDDCEGRRPGVAARPVADAVADRDRRRPAVAVRSPGGTGQGAGRRAAARPRPCRRSRACGRDSSCSGARRSSSRRPSSCCRSTCRRCSASTR